MAGGKQALVVILILVGLYLAIVHRPPLPLNHESLGLGTNHIIHTIIGVILLVVSGVVWFTGRSAKSK